MAHFPKNDNRKTLKFNKSCNVFRVLVLFLTLWGMACNTGTIQLDATQAPEFALTGISCELSFDCDAGQLCLSGHCVKPKGCSRSSDCCSQKCLHCLCGSYCVAEGTTSRRYCRERCNR